MTAGIPGAGIAGMFYLGSAFLMPFQEVRRAAEGQSTAMSRRLVTRHFLIALSMVATLWATALLLEHLIMLLVSASTMRQLPPLLTYSAFVISSVTLVSILGGVQLMRLVLPPRNVLTPLKAVSSIAAPADEIA